MDPEVFSGRPALLSVESSDRGVNAGEGRDVNPKDASAGTLQGPQHAAGESNRRAGWWTPFRGPLCSQGVLLHALKRAGHCAAVAGEG